MTSPTKNSNPKLKNIS